MSHTFPKGNCTLKHCQCSSFLPTINKVTILFVLPVEVKLEYLPKGALSSFCPPQAWDCVSSSYGEHVGKRMHIVTKISNRTRTTWAPLLLSSVEGQPTVCSHFIPGLPTAKKTSYFLCHMTDKVTTFRHKHTVWIGQPKHQAESCSSWSWFSVGSLLIALWLEPTHVFPLF